MAGGAQNASTPGGGEQTVTLAFRDFRSFLRRFSGNLAPEGMFVETPDPLAPGTTPELLIRLENGDVLVRGRGEVLWTSVTGEEGATATGMAIRFSELDPESELLVERVVTVRLDEGQPVFSLGVDAASPSESPRPRAAASELERLEERHAAERARLRSELEQAQASETELRARLSTALAREEEALRSRDEMAEKLHDVETARSERRASLEELRYENLTLEQRLAEQEGELERFRQMGSHAAAERNRLESQKRALGAKLESARAELASFASECETLRGESGAEREELERRLAESRATEERLRAEVAELGESSAAAEQRAAAVEEELASVTEELESTRAEAAGLERTLERSGRELDEVGGRLEETLDRLRVGAERSGRLESELASVREELEALRGVESRLASERRSALRAAKLAERVRSEHAALQHDLAEAQARLEEVEDAKRRLEAGLAAAGEGERRGGAESADAEPVAGGEAEVDGSTADAPVLEAPPVPAQTWGPRAFEDLEADGDPERHGLKGALATAFSRLMPGRNGVAEPAPAGGEPESEGATAVPGPDPGDS